MRSPILYFLTILAVGLVITIILGRACTPEPDDIIDREVLDDIMKRNKEARLILEQRINCLNDSLSEQDSIVKERDKEIAELRRINEQNISHLQTIPSTDLKRLLDTMLPPDGGDTIILIQRKRGLAIAEIKYDRDAFEQIIDIQTIQINDLKGMINIKDEIIETCKEITVQDSITKEEYKAVALDALDEKEKWKKKAKKEEKKGNIKTGIIAGETIAIVGFFTYIIFGK